MEWGSNRVLSTAGTSIFTDGSKIDGRLTGLLETQREGSSSGISEGMLPVKIPIQLVKQDIDRSVHTAASLH